jgi:hypothetical protein
MSLDVILELLMSRYRRRLLVALLEHNPQDDRDPLLPPDTVSTEMDTERLRIAIQHTHLPKLEAAGVVEWDRETNQISKGPEFDELRPLLQLLYDHADELPRDWL